MNPNTKLSIYVAERLESAPNEMITEWYHTFLILVDETTWPVKVIQQLHFDADSNNSYSLMPIALEGTSDPIQFPNRFDGVLVYPVVGGGERCFKYVEQCLSLLFLPKTYEYTLR